MAFEVFTGARTKNSDFISLTASKTFGFPRAFIENNDIKDNNKVVILYDQETERIALYFSDKDPKHGYAFRRSKNKKHGGMVIARNFFESKNIDVDKFAQRYDYEKIPLADLGFPGKTGNAFVIKLVSANKPQPQATEDVIIDDVDDTPIDMSDIQF